MPLLRALFVLLLLALPARAEPAADWERLPDGRVVIEIYGRRFAFPPDLPQGMVSFTHGQRPHPTRPGGWEERTASLQEVIADRAMAERWWTGSHPSMPVGINLSTRLVAPFLFEGEGAVDRRSIRLNAAFEVWVYQDPGRVECQPHDPITWPRHSRECDYFLERSRDIAARDERGFVVETPPFLRGTNRVYHVFPEHERRTPPGDTAMINCLEYSQFFDCENHSAVKTGYIIRPGIFFRYRYSTRKIDRPDMRRIDDAFRAAALRFLLDDAPPRP